MKHLFEINYEDQTYIFDLHKKLISNKKDTDYSYFLEAKDFKEIYQSINDTLLKIVSEHWEENS